MSKIDINKKYQTRDGKKVRIYCTDGGGIHPVHGAILEDNGEWCGLTWTSVGLYHYSLHAISDFDLIEAPKEHTVDVWIRLWDDGTAGPSSNPCCVEFYPGIVAQKKFTLTIKEGEFDDN